MAEIQFENENEFARPAAVQESSGLVALVQKWGLAKDDKQAEYVLLGATVAMLIFAGVAWFFLNSSSSPTPLPPGTLVPGPNGSATFTK